MDSVAHANPKLHKILQDANNVLDLEEIYAIQSEERQLNEEIPKLDDEIRTYQDILSVHPQTKRYALLLQGAQKRKDDACSALLRYQQLLLPSFVRAIPDEVLCKIFIQFLAMVHSEDYDVRYKRSDEDLPNRNARLSLWVDTDRVYIPHTVLRLVCRRWNRVAVSEPRLWQTVPLEIPRLLADSSDPEAKERLNNKYWGQVARNIERACTLSLDLQVRATYLVMSPIAQDFLRRLMELLPRTTYLNLKYKPLRNWHRLVASTFPLPSPSDLYAVTNLVAYRLPQCTEDDEVLDRWILSLMSHMPKLRFASLPCMPYEKHDRTQRFPSDGRCPTLSTVQMGETGVGILFSLFEFAHSLTSLAIDEILAGSHNVVLQHPKVSEFLISGQFTVAYRLEQFTFPALKRLEIGRANMSEKDAHSEANTLEWRQDVVSQFFARSGYPVLTHLAIHCRLTQPEDVVPFLLSQPSLRSLALRSAPQSLLSLLCLPKFLELASLDIVVPMYQDQEYAVFLELMERLGTRRDVIERGEACQCLSWKIEFHLKRWQLIEVTQTLRADMRKMEAYFEAIGSRLVLTRTRCEYSK
ncbi:hypothetical protein CYLTODRAFT_420048 [Cylindrobasidium torrendii FP15055 ss-10]|uniref:Uncharacterized protein n=1 Tax=Cylindrobasidium torrendii FP15055 ss-10 TaxID=1314674 RepID=A0A0D7BIC0_9AGAR|nr:hypothetical protein CYLTODRAFT_420048 [Cylindrobasidium torrendii FP15055 ss-10]